MDGQKKVCTCSILERPSIGCLFGNIVCMSYDYTELVKAPPNQTKLYRVHLCERKQRATETLSKLDQDIRSLTNLAYPTEPSDLRETLAKKQFVDALVSSDIRLRIKQAGPSNLNDTVRHAVELEAFNSAERKHLEVKVIWEPQMRSLKER